MGDASGIEWTDATWNPVRGCRKISPGCKHCYAETFAERWRGVPGHPYSQGLGARPCEIGWIRSIIRQARAANVPCFVKQLGAHPRLDGRAPGQARGTPVGETLINIRHRKGADRGEWPRDLDVAEFPEVPSCA